jgi:hypothetical protein
MVMFKDVVAATMISKNVTWAEQSDNACPNFDAEAQSAGKLRDRANKRRTWQRRTRGRWAGNGVCNATSFDMTTEEGNAGNTSLENVFGSWTEGQRVDHAPRNSNGQRGDQAPRTTVYEYDAAGENRNEFTAGNPLELAENQDLCSDVIRRLEEGDEVARLSVVLWFHKVTVQLALSKSGCRVVQKALEVTGGSDRELIIAQLKDNIKELYASPHGNYVLSRAIEVLPASRTTFISSALVGQAVTVSKHKFGCRVLCRLIEHCTEAEIRSLLDEIVAEADMLAHHVYGNFVVQTTLEHGTDARRKAILSQVLPGFSALASHRTGSLVAQRVLDYCDVESQNLALSALLYAEGENSVVEVARSHYGSYVLEQLAGMQQRQPVVSDIAQVLANNLDYLATSQHAERVVIAFGLAPEPLKQQVLD